MTSKTTPEHAAHERRPLPADGDGFLVDAQLWNPAMARTIAHMDDVGPLTPEHWFVLYYLREHGLAFDSASPISQICCAQGTDRRSIRRLFGSCRQAWRIAGLPHPGDEALARMT
jgi:tRNA 2-thiouridine synthesizing protein E